MSARRAGRLTADPLVRPGNTALTGENGSTSHPLPPPAVTLDSVLDAVTVGVVVHDGDGVVLASNAAARSMLTGLPATVLANAVTPVGRERGGPRSFTLSTPRPDGSARRLVATAVPLPPTTTIELTQATTDTALTEGCAGVVTTLRDLAIERQPGQSPQRSARPDGESATLRRSLAMAERRLRATVDNSPVGSALLTPHGRVLQANRALGRLLGRTGPELVGIGLADVTHPDDAGREAPLHERLLARAIGSYELEKRFLRPGGDSVWVRVTVTPVCDDQGGVLHLVMQAQDVTETRLAVEMLTHQAMHDPLTGLANRAMCVEKIQQAMQRSRRTGTSAAVLTCDLDDFRVVNDSVGPGFGDAVLIEIANRLAQAIGPRDTVARLAGDEFVVVREEVSGEPEAVELARRLLAAVREPVEVDGRVVMPTASIGIAVSGPRDEDPLRLLRDAGTALHRAKEQGRGSWQVMDEDLRRRTVDRMDVESQLRSGLALGQLRLHVQPIVDLTNGDIVGREALVRWQHPERGLLPPARFLPVAEETGLIEDLGRWVIGEAARIAAATPELGYVAINVSPSQVRSSGLADDVEAALATSRLSPSQLVVELTESVMLGAAPDGRAQLERLDALGVRLVVDDFGTGFSALSHLRDLPVSGIKIDRSFTQGLGRDTHCERIVEALTGLAQGLGVDLVAEGVETEHQAELLTGIGCLHAQGYLFGRPEPAVFRLP
ncbi:MAG: EAL domain-containing protein [Kineosporiaceae bacterium]